MEANPYDEAVYSKNVLEMLTLANEYCLFVEKADNYPKEDILEFMRKLLPMLYIKASLLPEIIPDNEEANERYVTQEVWENIFYSLREKFQADDEYFHIDNNNISETDPVKGSLADNLSDIYQDLKDFVVLYQKNILDAKENAVFSCKHLFERHWGYRIVSALKYIHYIKFADLSIDDEIIF